MKQVFIFNDEIHNKTTKTEVAIRNLEHFKTQLNTRAQVFRDKTKYSRKTKHKNLEY